MVTQTNLFLILSLICFGCIDSKLIISRQAFNGSSLNLNGYYYNITKGQYRYAIDIYFFYNNGIVYRGGSGVAELNVSNNELLGNMDKYLYSKVMNQSKTGWGTFHITSNEIQFETWEPSSGGPLKTVIRSGKILNDTTFTITKFINNYDGKTTSKNDVYHFRPFTPKPDSTNKFIE